MSPALAATSNALDRMIVVEEVLPSGKKVWVATDMDNDGCIAQGDSDPEAKAALIEARRDYGEVVKIQRLTPRHEIHSSTTVRRQEGVYVFGGNVFAY